LEEAEGSAAGVDEPPICFVKKGRQAPSVFAPSLLADSAPSKKLPLLPVPSHLRLILTAISCAGSNQPG
jgi:hypothetical protein